MRSSFLAILSLLAISGCGCNKNRDSAIAYGDPVGVRIADPNDATSGTEIEAAFSVNAGEEPDKLTPGIARVLHKAAKACPAAVTLTKRGDMLRIRGRIESGVMSIEPIGEPQEAACVGKALDKERVLEGSTKTLDLVMEIAARQATVAKP